MFRELAQTPARLKRGRGLGDRAGIKAGRRQSRHNLRFRDRPLEPFADEIRLPAGQVDQPLKRNTGCCRAPERERDELNGATDNLDRHVLTGLRTAHSCIEVTASR